MSEGRRRQRGGDNSVKEDKLTKAVRTAVSRRALFRPGASLLLAVSGGADSVALTHAMYELSSELGLHLHIGHLNHALRGREAEEDTAFVRQLAAGLGLAVKMGRADVRGRSRRRGISLEMAAREARYGFLRRAARAFGTDTVVTAHTADDLAETVVLKMARGAGPHGLAGIRWRIDLEGITVVRPLLAATRADVITFLNRRNLSWREDTSNTDLSFLRNRVRHEILPILAARLNPQIGNALRRTADILREEDEWIEQIAEGELAKCRVHGSRAAPALDVVAVAQRPLALRRRMLRRWMAESGLPAELTDHDLVERVARLLERTNGKAEASAPGDRTIVRDYDRLYVDACRGGAVPFRERVRVPGETLLVSPRLRVTTEWRPGIVRSGRGKIGALPARVSLRGSTMAKRVLAVRSWKPGDRMRPLGLDGSKKIQDIFVDEKVPARLRSRIPVFECGGEIVWVPGYRIARDWAVLEPEEDSLQVSVEHL